VPDYVKAANYAAIDDPNTSQMEVRLVQLLLVLQTGFTA
jgi:hypothetical protein